LTLKI